MAQDIQTVELTDLKTIKSLQIGVGWLPEEKGNGLDRMFHALTRYLPHSGVEVSGHVVGSSKVHENSGFKVKAFAEKDVSLQRRLGLLRNNIREDVKSGVYDLVASHFALFTFPVLRAIRKLPLVVHFHGPWAAESKAEGEGGLAVKAKWLVERNVYKKADRFIVLSDAFKQVLIRNYNIPSDKIRIVRGGVHADRFDTGLTMDEARDQLGWARDRPTILVVRRLAKRMGLENLVAAVVRVKQQIPDVQLMIAGSGPLQAELEDRIQAASLQSHVSLLGFVPDDLLPTAYRAADFSIVPTVSLEGFGLITIESMAAGTPVLVTNVGGLPEVVRDLSEDMIIPDSEVKTLAAHIISVILGGIKLPDQLACQAYVRDRFDWPVIANEVRSVYEEVLS